MALPDISTLSLAELRELLNVAGQAYQKAESDERQQGEDRIARIGGAINALNTLLGPEDAVAGLDSIRAVRKFDEQTLGDNAGMALSLILAGLEEITRTTLDIAQAVSGKQ